MAVPRAGPKSLSIPAARWKSRPEPARLRSGNRVCRPPGLNLALDDRRILILFGGRRVSFVDKTLTCSDCGQPFTFTAGEQEFHSSKGFTNEPRRCPSCRQARRGSEGGARTGGGAPRQMFTATCGTCGNPAQVPFEPRGDRPVYCSTC